LKERSGLRMEKRETISWVLGTVMTLLALAGAWTAYHAQFEAAGTSDAGVGAVFLFLKSQNKSIATHYEDNIEKGINVEASEDRLQGLEYEERYIDNVQQALGVTDE
jgi:hypothetical protein